MELLHGAVAGTLESSDAQVRVEPSDALAIHIESSVMAQYGRQIRETVEDVLQRLEVERATVYVEDRGALDCTLRARVETALFRATDRKEGLPWEVLA